LLQEERESLRSAQQQKEQKEKKEFLEREQATRKATDENFEQGVRYLQQKYGTSNPAATEVRFNP
jgi:hypothetical protein